MKLKKNKFDENGTIHTILRNAEPTLHACSNFTQAFHIPAEAPKTTLSTSLENEGNPKR